MEPMRQGQQNRRGRGRNRKGHQNPLTRSFESNGPDVKLRGTPSHIAEKYISLARDAQSSGDPVLAENYLQHAEHYNRIIMAVREQQIAQGGDPMGGMSRGRPGDGLEGDEFGEDDGDEFGSDMPSMRGPEQQSQPRTYDQPRFPERPERHEHRGERHERSDRHEGHRQDRQHRDRDRGGYEGRNHHQHREHREHREPRGEHRGEPREFRERPVGEPRGGFQDRQPPAPVMQADREPPREPLAQAAERTSDRQEPRRRERFAPPPQPASEQPEFLRRPVRRPRREAIGEEGAAPAPAAAGTDEGNRD